MAEKKFNTQLPVFGDGEEHKHIGSIVKGDVGANSFVITLLDRHGKPFDMSDVNYITFTVNRPDGKVEVDSSLRKRPEGGQAPDMGESELAPGVVPVPQVSFDRESATVTIVPSSGAVSVAGECFATLELFDNDKRRVSTARFCFTVVSDLGSGYDIELDPHYPVLTNLIGECQVVLEARDEYVNAKDAVIASASAAAEAAEKAQEMADNAESSMDYAAAFALAARDYKDEAGNAASQAGIYKNVAESAAEAADNYSKLSKSYAVGTSGVRDGEDTDNSKYYKEQAEQAKGEAENAAQAADNAKSAAESAKYEAEMAKNEAVEAKEAAEALPRTYYGTCDSMVSDGIKVVNVDDSFTLNTGVVVDVKFRCENTHTLPKLNVNNTGAIYIRLNDYIGIKSYQWYHDSVVRFVYDGRYWIMQSAPIADKNFYGVTKLNSSIDSDDGTVSATPKAVKIVNDKIDALETKVNNTPKSYYGLCNTAAAEREKIVTVDDSFKLEVGATVNVRFNYNNTYLVPVLNVNNTGAKPMVKGTLITVGQNYWTVGGIVQFVYDGSYWVVSNALVGLSDSVENNSVTDAATSSAVKQAYDKAVEAKTVADAALPISGGAMTGDITFRDKGVKISGSGEIHSIGFEDTNSQQSVGMRQGFLYFGDESTDNFIQMYKETDNVLKIGKSSSANAGVRVKGVDAPVGDNDATNKKYVDEQISQHTKSALIYAGICPTDAETAEKHVSVLNTNFKIESGIMLAVYFNYGAGSSTNLTLNVNNKGAKPIYDWNIAPIPADYWRRDTVLLFYYTGSAWMVMGGQLATQYTYGVTKLSDSTTNNNPLIAASSSAVKKAYDKAVEAKTVADSAATPEYVNQTVSEFANGALQAVEENFLPKTGGVIEAAVGDTPAGDTKLTIKHGDAQIMLDAMTYADVDDGEGNISYAHDSMIIAGIQNENTISGAMMGTHYSIPFVASGGNNIGVISAFEGNDITDAFGDNALIMYSGGGVRALQNLTEPQNDTDAANKKYVDDADAVIKEIANTAKATADAALPKAGGILSGNLSLLNTSTSPRLSLNGVGYDNVLTNQQIELRHNGSSVSSLRLKADGSRNYITNLTTPQYDTDAVNKKYVDDAITGVSNGVSDDYLPLAGGTISGDLKVKNTSANKSHLQLRGYDEDSDFGGGDISYQEGKTTIEVGNVRGSGGRSFIFDSAGTNDDDNVVTFGDLNSAIASVSGGDIGGDYLPINGGTMTGNLILNGAPTTNLQAATKEYVDNAVPDMTSVATLANGLVPSSQLPTFYGVCSTSGATNAKTVSVNGTFTLRTGVSVRVKFSNGFSATEPTLNVNGTGAKAIMVYGTTRMTWDYWIPGGIFDFVYDGSYWVLTNGVKKASASNAYYGIVRLSNSVTSTSGELAATSNAVKQAYDKGNAAVPKASLLRFTNVTFAASTGVDDTTYDGYTTRYDIPCTGVTADYSADVRFAPADAVSGDFAPFCDTDDGVVKIYASRVRAGANPGETVDITIPAIICTKMVD